MDKVYTFKSKHSIEGNLSRKNVIVDDDSITINSNIILNISHGKKNYAFPIEAGTSFTYQKINSPTLLFFDVSITDGLLYLKQSTSLKYLKEKTTDSLPQEGEYGEIVFDLNSMSLKRWNGNNWVEVIGLVLGVLRDGTFEESFSSISQANMRGEFISSEIVYDRDLTPIRLKKSNGFEFLTHYEKNKLGFRKVETLSFENALCENIASSLIPEFTVVVRSDNLFITPATVGWLQEGIGLSAHSAAVNERCYIIERGFVKNSSWMWEDPPSTPLFFDSNGKLTTVSPIKTKDIGGNVVMAQKIGHVVDRDTIYFSPDRMYIL